MDHIQVLEKSRVAAEGDHARHLSNSHSHPGVEIKLDSIASPQQHDKILPSLDAMAPIAGVERIEAISSQLSKRDQGFLYFGILIASYVGGLDYLTRSTYQGFATASFGLHSLLATVNVLISVINAVDQPLTAKLADFFGRLEIYLFSVIFSVLGTIIASTASNIKVYCAGTVIYQIGFSTAYVLFAILIADMSTLKYRLLFAYTPIIPTAINSWIGGNVTSSVLSRTTWRWGIGMWGIVYPFASIPLIVILFIGQRRAAKAGTLQSLKIQRTEPSLLKEIFWRFDIVGVILMIASFALFLIPFTLAGEGTGTASQRWTRRHVLAPLIIGFLCFPAFGFWEAKIAKSPILPTRLFKDRGVWSGICIAILINITYMIQADYLFPMLFVGFHQTVASATRIALMWHFCSTISGVITGILVIKVRRVKPFIVAGGALFVISYGLLIKYRGHTSSVAGLVVAQVLMGIGVGLISSPTTIAIEARTKHEHVAIAIGIFFGSAYFGTAIGSAISGAIWTNLMPGKLAAQLDPIMPGLALRVYADPYTASAFFPVGTPARTGMINAYADVQRTLCITGFAFAILVFVFTLFLKNTYLVEAQSHPHAEKESIDDENKHKFWLWR